MLVTDPFSPVLPDGWAARVPLEHDIDPVRELLEEAQREHDPEAHVSRSDISSRLTGLRSWPRRQVVIVRALPDGGPDSEGPPVAWISCEDRAAGRVDVQWVVAADVPDRDALVTALLDWAEEAGGAFARHRGVEDTQLDTSADARDTERHRLLAAHGYEKVRTWLHMERPVTTEEAETTPEPREAVRVRRVYEHSTGMPVGQDVRTVHWVLEESFEDHFNSYRESFQEFAQRLIEPGEARWDHWWIAEVQQADGSWWPGGGLVCSVMPARGDKGEGTYLEYVGVHRSARGRGVAKALLYAAIRDAARRGRTRVGLEVDDDSPTGADGLYRSMGWETVEVTESWHSGARSHPSRLLAEGQSPTGSFDAATTD
ncbi:MAG: GNAT family N-acetyltransferase [Brachybacterium sp.]|nr:GNAT family N-acetyltransferase [Brachybacterium sp.]